MQRFLLALLALSLTSQLDAKTLEISGRYQGSDLFIYNPLHTDSTHCVMEVRVNGRKTADNCHAFAIAVDFEALDLVAGDSVHVEILTSSNCGARIVNPQAVEIRSTCKYTFTGLDMDGSKLTWKTEDEFGSLPFVVQQFRWNRWMNISQMDGRGNPESNTYHVQVATHRGQNRFRIYQQDDWGRNFSDPIVAVDEVTTEVRILTEKIRKELAFSEVTEFELYDAYGLLVMEGETDLLNVKELDKGTYYLNYGSHTGEAIRKR